MCTRLLLIHAYDVRRTRGRFRANQFAPSYIRLTAGIFPWNVSWNLLRFRLIFQEGRTVKMLPTRRTIAQRNFARLFQITIIYRYRIHIDLLFWKFRLLGYLDRYIWRRNEILWCTKLSLSEYNFLSLIVNICFRLANLLLTDCYNKYQIK